MLQHYHSHTGVLSRKKMDVGVVKGQREQTLEGCPQYHQAGRGASLEQPPQPFLHGSDAWIAVPGDKTQNLVAPRNKKRNKNK